MSPSDVGVTTPIERSSVTVQTNGSHTDGLAFGNQSPVEQVNLPVREEKSRGVYVAGATEEYVTSAEEVKDCLLPFLPSFIEAQAFRIEMNACIITSTYLYFSFLCWGKFVCMYVCVCVCVTLPLS